MPNKYDYRRKMNYPNRPHSETRGAGETAIKGIIDVTKIATVGMIGVGVLGTLGAAFKK
jgi:hypothetical protein